MTTDGAAQPPPDAATEARLDALRQRRATSTHGNRPTPAKTRRRHPAAGARILVGSVSASAALGLIAMMAGADSGPTVAESSPASPSPEPVVVVDRSSTDAVSSVAPAPIVTASTAAPVTSSQAS